MMFTGKGQMPKMFAEEKKLIEAVASTEGAIGYISAGKETDQVKIILVN